MDNQEIKSGEQRFDKKWDRKEWEENMGDIVDLDQRDKYSDAIEDIVETMQETIQKISNAVKKTDTVKIFERIANQIMPKVTKIKTLMEDLETIKKELNDRNLENPEINELIESEIEDIELWKNFEIDVKKEIGKAVIGIGKDAVKGATDLGLNMIGATVIGVGKIIRGIKDIGTGNIYKIADETSIQKIQEKREENKRIKNYEIITDDEEEIEQNVKNNHMGQDIPFEDNRYYIDDIQEYSEEEYEEYEYEKIKKENFVKRTIKGVKGFGTEVGKKFKWIKDREARQTFINKQKEKIKNAVKDTDTYRNAVRIGKEVQYNYNVTKDKVKEEAKNIQEKATQRYEDTKKKFELNKTTVFKTVLENGAKFAKKILNIIEPKIESQTEKEDKLRKEVESKDKQINKNINKNTLER